MKRHVGLLDIFLVALASALTSVILWRDLEPKAVIFFILGLGLVELMVMARWRISIACMRCGFDPVLYQKSSDQAALRVRAHMERRRQDPLSIFSPLPQLSSIKKKPDAGPRHP